MNVYRIAKWESVFERSESRKLKQLTWVAMPIGFTSHGYQSILDEFGDDAPAIYGAWCALVAVAAGCAHRGILGSGRGIPLTISRIARMTGFPADLYERLFAWAARPDISWLEVLDGEELTEILGEEPCFPHENGTSGDSPDDFPACQEIPPTTGQDITVQDKTEQDTSGGAAEAAATAGDEELQDWISWWNSLRKETPPLVSAGAEPHPPSAAVLKAWRKVKRDSRLRGMLADRAAIEGQIRASPFVRRGWFRLEKLLAGKNDDGEWIVRKLLDGSYREDTKPKPRELHDSRNDKQAAGRGSLFGSR